MWCRGRPSASSLGTSPHAQTASLASLLQLRPPEHDLVESPSRVGRSESPRERGRGPKTQMPLKSDDGGRNRHFLFVHGTPTRGATAAWQHAVHRGWRAAVLACSKRSISAHTETRRGTAWCRTDAFQFPLLGFSELCACRCTVQHSPPHTFDIRMKIANVEALHLKIPNIAEVRSAPAYHGSLRVVLRGRRSQPASLEPARAILFPAIVTPLMRGPCVCLHRWPMGRRTCCWCE